MPPTLLLADDSVTIQRVIELTFADEDIRVVAVGDGKQAIERIQAEPPDIVLADVGMPERDGYEVAAFVKGRPDLASVPVLLLTGAFEPIDERRARAAGCDGVLVKPFEPQVVINRVKDLLAGRRPEGLWAGASTQPPPRQSPGPPASTAPDLRPGQQPDGQPSQAGNASLEDYFDRLDAAFAEFDAAPGAPPPQPVAAHLPGPPPQVPPAESGDRLGDAEKAEAPRAPVTAPVPVTLPPGPSLAEAFAALLAAEQGQPIAPAAIRPADVPESTIDDIVRRVAERVSGESVRSIVLEVAERLVREEIAKIKRG